MYICVIWRHAEFLLRKLFVFPSIQAQQGIASKKMTLGSQWDWPEC